MGAKWRLVSRVDADRVGDPSVVWIREGWDPGPGPRLDEVMPSVGFEVSAAGELSECQVRMRLLEEDNDQSRR